MLGEGELSLTTQNMSILTLGALLAHLVTNRVMTVDMKRMILTLKALMKHLIKAVLRQMTWKRLSLFLKALLRKLEVI